MAEELKPGLFGIKNSNRDFKLKDSWGKNQFNSSFPASLAAYLSSQGLKNVYIKLKKDLKTEHDKISTADLFGMDPNSDSIFYAFEFQFSPYQQLIVGDLPRVDLVIQDTKNKGACIKGLEIKLTALPDNSTCNLTADKYSCEIVIRPDTIVYLACSIALNYKDNLKGLKKFFGKEFDKIKDWTNAENVAPYVTSMIKILGEISLDIIDQQEPLVMQPIWKTNGKSFELADNCLDVFVWSNLAFIKLFSDEALEEVKDNKITRPIRSIIWVFKMLYDFSKDGQFNHKNIIDKLSYNTKNDKAFASNGMVTYPFLKSEELKSPRITKDKIKQIILGGGQNLLSPERRFDAIIFSAQDLF